MRTLKKFSRRAATVLLLLVSAQASAHNWKTDAQALTPEDVGPVVTALEQLAASASQSGWSPASSSQGSLTAGLYDYAIATGQLTALPEATDRVIETFEALEQGIVTAEGNYTDSPDFIFWAEYLHLEDVPAVAARRDALRAIQAVFAGKGSQ